MTRYQGNFSDLSCRVLRSGWLPLLLALAGCVTTVDNPQGRRVTEPVIEEQAVADVAKVRPELPPVSRRVDRSFDKDTLYELLVAEVAGYRRDFVTALAGYRRVAANTGDAGVAARGMRLASFLGDDEATLELAVLWAAADPSAIEAHHNAANQLTGAGRLAEAVRHLEMVQRLGGFADFEAVAHGAAGLDQEGRERLLTAIEELLERQETNRQLLFTKAVLLVRAGDPAAALGIVDALLAERPDDVNLMILQIDALRELGRESEALEYLATYLDANPGRHRLRGYYAHLLYGAGELAAADGEYRQMLRRMPRDGDVLLALALIAMQREQPDVARDFLQRMVRYGQRVGEAHFYLGTLAEQDGDADVALRHFRQAGTGHEFMPAQGRIAVILNERDGLAAARAHLERMRGEHPQRLEQLFLLEADLLTRETVPTEVLFDFLDICLAQLPDSLDLLYYRAMVGGRNDDLVVLERDLRRILDLDPQHADALNSLGYTLADRTDRHEEALELIARAVAIRPDDAAFIDSLGWVHYRLRNYDDAVGHLRRALSLIQNDEIAAHLGEVLWVTGAREEARRVWRQGLEAAPQSRLIREAMERLSGDSVSRPDVRRASD